MRQLILSLFIMLATAAAAQNGGTVRQQMDALHSRFGVDFIYDSSLKTAQPYGGKPLKGMKLKDALTELFKGTGIDYTLSGRYVILRRNTPKPERKDKNPVEKKRYTLSGFVRDDSGESLINATVSDMTTGALTTTNSYGFYSMTLDGGEHRLRFSYVGFDERTEPVRLTADRTVNISLNPAASIGETVVTADMNSPLLSTQTGRRSLSGDELHPSYSLLSSPDMIKTLQRTSGVAGGIELLSGMYVHGGADDENLFLLDGVPVYQINHTLGLFSAFNPDVIKNVDFYKSGFPARYAGRLSSITDVRTKDGDMQHTHGSYSIGLWDARFQLDGPITRGKTSFNIGMRTNWAGVVALPLEQLFTSDKDDNTKLTYIVHDLNAKLTHVFNDRSRMWVSLYSGMDWMWTKYHFRSDSSADAERENSTGRMEWGNLNLTANWNYVFSPRLFADFSGVFAYNRSIYVSKDDDHYGNIPQNVDHSDHQYRSKIYDTGFHADFDYRPDTRNHIRFGTDYTLHRFLPQSQMRLDFSGNENSGIDTIRINSRNRHTAHELNLYAEDQLSISPRWDVNFGAHASMFAIGSKNFFNIDPRMALKYQASASTALKLSFTGMTQYVHRLGNTYISMPTDYWVPTTERLRPMRSWQLAAGIYNRPAAGWLLSLEGFYKDTRHILQYTNLNGMTPPAGNWDLFVAEGRGRSYGTEFDASYKGQRFTFEGSYTLSWSLRNFSELYDGWFYDKFDSRHRINLTVAYKLSQKVEMYAAWTCNTGYRFTVPTQYVQNPSIPGASWQQNVYGGDYFGPTYITVYEKPNNLVLPLYHRLDVGFNFNHTTKHGHLRTWNLSLYNAYCRMNTLYAEVEQDYLTGQIRLKKHSWIPILPSFSYTIKF